MFAALQLHLSMEFGHSLQTLLTLIISSLDVAECVMSFVLTCWPNLALYSSMQVSFIMLWSYMLCKS